MNNELIDQAIVILESLRLKEAESVSFRNDGKRFVLDVTFGDYRQGILTEGEGKPIQYTTKPQYAQDYYMSSDNTVARDIIKDKDFVEFNNSKSFRKHQGFCI